MNSRNILITGANGGLGLAMARAFLKDAETQLWLGVRQSRDNAQKLAGEFPERARLVPLDVTSAGAWSAAIELAGPVSVLINNAGIHDDALLGTMTAAQWDQVIASNLTGTFLGCQAVIRGMMAQRWGRIVNVSSLSALLAPAGQTNYAAAKAGIVALTQSLAKEVARAGITVNAVCPGYIETEALDDMAGAARESRKAQIPMRRFGRPEEVASAVRFLASEEASYITGAVVKIDGGIF
ncbi:MAG: SDR family oxidoreductase [Verrucomicrobiales bacterium]